uniref:Uncharacterized protein n=1 Tax=Ditylenchus dipsaci TaxID=166011 RepID=A0A915ER07_9BILA
MPFMRGAMPLRRTIFHLQQGKILFRNDVAVFVVGYRNKKGLTLEQRGASEFLIKRLDLQSTPYALAFLNSGEEVLFDLESKTKDEIVDIIQGTLGKTSLVNKIEFLEKMRENNVAEFGDKCSRHCMCEVQGQQPCTALITAPDYMKGNWRWNHKNTR